jgi:hypothetical protein
MTGVHPDIGPELRKLAQAILNGIDPVVRAAASRASGDGAGTGKCQQILCPVGALTAAVTGEEHPLLTVVAEHSVALLAVIRAMVEDLDGSTPPPGGSPGGGVPAETPADASAASQYQPIVVTVEEERNGRGCGSQLTGE